MGYISCYKEGMRLFQEKEYAKAIEQFKCGVGLGYNGQCLTMLGKCSEHGLGMETDLILAKDYYKCALQDFEVFPKSHPEEILWLKNKIEELKEVPDIKEQSGFIESVGWVKVKRTRVEEWSIKYTEEGTVVNISRFKPFYEGFLLARIHTADENKNWTCDGYTRFYDGYTLDTDFFSLVVKRGTTDEYKSIIDGRNCTVIFPCDADLGYLYVQGTIMNKVLDLLQKIAEVVIPQKLNELSQRMGISYGKCKIARRMTWNFGIWYAITNDIHIALRCIMLPEECLEAICAHELTHCLVPNHQVEFWQTFKERAGEHLVRLDMRLGDGYIPYRWRPLKWKCRP